MIKIIAFFLFCFVCGFVNAMIKDRLKHGQWFWQFFKDMNNRG